MRLITLNCWGGRSLYPLTRFFRRRKDDADAFLLQEVFDGDQAALDARHPGECLRADLFRMIAAELDGFRGIFARWEDPDRMSTAIFVRKTIPILAEAASTVYEPEKPSFEGAKVISPRKLQTVTVPFGDRRLLLANLHGLWDAGPKTDTQERLAQSCNVVRKLDDHSGPKVLCGDFNLLPGTTSVAILKDAGLRDLVGEYGVASTRTPLYRRYDDPSEPNFADYVMPSADLEVKRFEVMADLVSDHCPLYVELA